MSLQFTNAIDLLTGTDTNAGSVGVTVDTTGTGFDVSLRSQITVHFVCTGHVSGNGVFSIDGSNDGVHWITGIACQDLTSATSTTFVTSKTLNTSTSAGVKVPSGLRFIRAVVDVTTDGTYFAFMEASG